MTVINVCSINFLFLSCVLHIKWDKATEFQAEQLYPRIIFLLVKI